MKTHQYGIDVNSLEKFILRPSREEKEWGSLLEVSPESAPYRLHQLNIGAGKTALLQTEKNEEATLFVEKGSVAVNEVALSPLETMTLKPGGSFSCVAETDSLVYLFFGALSSESKYGQKSKTFDYRDKYWGDIQSIVSKEYSGKRLYVRKGTQASLEFHCQKIETYYVESGKLLVRLRAGRGEDRYFEMGAGSAMLIPPGLMHQRGGLEDTVIIEISTRDNDADSFLVEDGQKVKMPNLPSI